MASFSDYFNKGIGESLGGLPTSFLDMGVRWLGNSIFNKQQEKSSKRLMDYQNKLNLQNTFLQPILNKEGIKASGMSPAFSDGPSQSVASPSVPLPSTANDVTFNPLLFEQIKGLHLQNQKQETENAHYEDKLLSEIQLNTANSLLSDSQRILNANENERYELLKTFVGGETEYGQILADNMTANLQNLFLRNKELKATFAKSKAGKRLIDKQVQETDEKINKLVAEIQQMPEYLAIASKQLIINARNASANEKTANANTNNAYNNFLNAGAKLWDVETESSLRKKTEDLLEKNGFKIDAERHNVEIEGKWIAISKVMSCIMDAGLASYGATGAVKNVLKMLSH